MGKVKYSFIPKIGFLKNQLIAPSKGKRFLLTSYNVYDVTERALRDDNGNETLMAQGAKQDFILHFKT